MSKISKDDIVALENSGRFDAKWYGETYADVSTSGMSPAEHYLWIGARLGRSGMATSNVVLPSSTKSEAGGAPSLDWLVSRPATEGAATPAKVIAFYLPQFHPIAENNRWWGNGFTEWTNVRAAKPQFIGHNQPLVPHSSIGYYSLEDPDTIRKQVSMARSFGVHGFCIYYYWFAGKRLLEKPLDLLLENPDIDFPFCVCWANENWTRRWDGLDQDVLIAQDHSAEDDLACIVDLAKYVRDARYIRIDGKPLIVVYRPELMPDPVATSRRWREWARANGIGELYLACVHSFENADPLKYGFDAAIDFPPANSSPPDVTSTVSTGQNDFEGSVYDWGVFIERSENMAVRDYPVFPGVNPGWDNTARKKNRAHIFTGATPDLFQLWLDRAIAHSMTSKNNESERLIFVNAWNEWAEGAVLEPRADLGYSYLQALKNAQDRHQSGTKLAVAIHAYYPEILPDLMKQIRLLPPGTKLFVSCMVDSIEAVRSELQGSGREFKIYPVANHGRDVLPFIKMLPDIDRQHYDFVIKVHTKRSDHRVDGDQWRKELCDAVLELSSVNRAIAALIERPDIGMIGPSNHFVEMNTYLGSNRDRLIQYSARLGCSEKQVLDLGFFAGTMFIARVSALRQLIELNIDDASFEPEQGQIDGTLAHVLERVLAVCVYSGGFRLVGNEDPLGELPMNLRYGFA